MKFFKLFLVLALIIGASFIAVSPAFAMICKNGNYGSDECWTTGQSTTNDGAVLTGTVMVYDFVTPASEGGDADHAAFYVRAATSSDQAVYVAGVAQKNYASGDRIEMLVRGQGKIRASAALASGDRLYLLGGSTAATKGLAANTNAFHATAANSRDKAIAFSLATTTAAATADVYIVVV